MTITHVQLLSLPVADQDRAKAFYTDKLGFDLLADTTESQQRWVQVGPPGADTSITLVTWFDSMPAGSVRGLVLETDNLEGEVATLTDRGIKINDGIQTEAWGRYVTFEDPDGNGIVLMASHAG